MQIVKYLPPETYVVTASTGCAASIIGAATLHSTMGIGIATQAARTYVHKIKKNMPVVYERTRRIKTLILDEVSMLDGATFNKAGLVAAILRRHGDVSDEEMANPAAFTLWDNIQIICCGDFLQMPPVKASQNGWIFCSRAWKELRFRNHMLTQIYRQSGDLLFAEVLGRIRVGEGLASDLVFLMKHSAAQEPANCLQLFAINKPADLLNETRFKELVKPLGQCVPHCFRAIDTGKKLELLEQCQAPPLLWLCDGARVMCLRNLIHGVLVNGSTGTVVSIKPFMDLATQKVCGALVVVMFDGMLGAKPFQHTFQTYDSCMSESDVARNMEFTIMEGKNKVASRIQIPLRLAWAVSIHKAQGMSLERASINFGGVFENGQCYTALSRMRTLTGVFLKNLTLKHLRMASPKANEWYKSIVFQHWDRT